MNSTFNIKWCCQIGIQTGVWWKHKHNWALFLILSQKDCDKCDKLRGELEQKNEKILEKDGLIKQLKALCSKFETQLNQQVG